jgi:hypothetical protein
VKYTMIAVLLIVSIGVAGCQTCPKQTEQLILNVPAELMQQPPTLNKL